MVMVIAGFTLYESPGWVAPNGYAWTYGPHKLGGQNAYIRQPNKDVALFYVHLAGRVESIRGGLMDALALGYDMLTTTTTVVKEADT